MNRKITYLINIVILFNLNLYSQKTEFTVNGGEFKLGNNTPCLTDAQRNDVKQSIWQNIEKLRAENKLMYSDNEVNRGGQVLFNWPVQKAAGLEYNDVWGISGYVDHNPAYPNQLLDYNCGSRTYDTQSGYNHAGVDIFTWPFGWKLMDTSQAEIVAVASGQIIAKGDGQYDRSCNFNNNVWNAVYVQHADGSIAWYGHMKSGSLTSKQVGDFVTSGEYLGIVGSSGNSTGPHLHFEVYSNATLTQLIDPYAGSCNSMNTTTRWQNQKPYINTNINAALTHSVPPVFPTCPQQEITNESNQFNPGQTIYFGVYLRDQAANTIINLKIRRPDNTIFESWNYNLTQNYNASYWYWNNNTFTIQGEWKWEVTYLGQTVVHPFNVGNLSVDENSLNSVSVYPNPFNDKLTISSEQIIKKATIVDMLGKTIYNQQNFSEGIETINLQNISKGMYFLVLESEKNQSKTIKIVKN